jgi:hypothetical protein
MSNDPPSSCTWQISAAPARRPRRSASTASGSRAVPVAAVGPLKAIDGLPRSGQPPELTEASRSWLIGEACAQPKDRGYPHELWTLRLLAIHPRCYGPLAGHACLAQLAASAVHGILNSQTVKPHKVRYYLERRDPEFDKRKAEVLEVYAAAEMLRALPEAERPVAILSYDPVDQPCGGCGAKRRWKSVVHALHVMVRCIDCGCADHQVLAAGERGGGLQHLWLDAGGAILRRGAAIDLKVSTAA